MKTRAPRDERRLRSLETPEGITLPLELADLGQRIGAFLTDVAILIAGFILFTIAIGLTGRAIGSSAGGRVAFALWIAGAFFARNLYFIWMEARPRAATFGKRWLGLRVVARDGGRLTLDAVIARNALREVEFFMPLGFAAAAFGGDGDRLTLWVGLGWSLIFLLLPTMNADRLRAGDLLAGTWVIREPRRPLLPELMGETGAAPDFTEAELDAYGVKELETLERVLRDPERDAIETVARTIRGRIGRTDFGDLGGWGDLAFLEAFYAALRIRLEERLLMGRRKADKHETG